MLFTSYAFNVRAAEKLGPWFNRNHYTLLVQGGGLPTPKLLEQFRDARALFGVDSFWQGVDVRGECGVERHHHEAALWPYRTAR